MPVYKCHRCDGTFDLEDANMIYDPVDDMYDRGLVANYIATCPFCQADEIVEYEDETEEETGYSA